MGIISRFPGGGGSSPVYPYNVSDLSTTLDLGAGTVTLDWTDPVTDFDKTVIRRKPNGYPTSENDGVQVYSGTAGEATDGGNIAAGSYYYQAFPFGTGGGVSNNAANRVSDPIVIAAPAAVTAFTAAAGNTKATLSWTFADSSVVSGVKITATNDVGAVAVYEGAGTNNSTEITGLTNGTAYTFYCWAKNGFGLYAASSVSASVTPAAVPAGSLYYEGNECTNVTGGWSGIAANGGAGTLTKDTSTMTVSCNTTKSGSCYRCVTTTKVDLTGYSTLKIRVTGVTGSRWKGLIIDPNSPDGDSTGNVVITAAGDISLDITSSQGEYYVGFQANETGSVTASRVWME